MVDLYFHTLAIDVFVLAFLIVKSVCFYYFIFLLASNSYSQVSSEPFQYHGEDHLELNGEMEFFWERLKNEADKSEADLIVSVPTRWNKLEIEGHQLGSFGYATYRGIIESDQDYSSAGFTLSGFYSAYRLYLNGALVAKNGVIGDSPASSTLEWLPMTIPVELKRGKNDLIVEISNYQHFKGGFYHPIVLGQYQSLQADRQRNIMTQVFSVGAYFMMGLFFLGMYFFWRKSVEILIYVALALSLSIRIPTSDLHLFNQIFTAVPWWFSVKLEYLSLYTSWLCFGLVFKRVFHRWFIWSGGTLIVLLMSSVMFLPLYWYSQFFILLIFVAWGLIFYGLVRIFQYHWPARRSFYTSLLFYGFMLIYWGGEFFVYYQNLTGSVSFIPEAALMLAVLSLAFLISETYTVEYEEVERLRLEAVQQKQTIELQYDEQNRQRILLQERNLKIETLFKEVHHRVKNNLQLISSLLDVDRYWNTNIDPHRVLDDSKGRVATISLIHQSLYINDDLTGIGFKEYLAELVSQLRDINKVDTVADIKMDIDPITLNVDTMVPLGLIMTELITNAFKHANHLGNLRLSLELRAGTDANHSLTIKDNGPNLPSSFVELVKRSYGLRLASRLARQLKGSLEHEYMNGNCFVINFSETGANE